MLAAPVSKASPPELFRLTRTSSPAELQSMTSPLRIAVILERDAVEPWQLAIFKELARREHYAVVAVVIRAPARDAGGERGQSGLAGLVNRLERRVAGALFRRVFAGSRRVGDRPIPRGDVLSADAIVITSLDDAAQVVERDGIDLVLDLTSRPEPDCAVRAGQARYWWLTIGHAPDGVQSQGLPEGFAEVSRGDYSTQAALWQVAGDTGRAEMVDRGVYRTFLWSWSENTRQLRYKAALMAVDALRALAAGGGLKGRRPAVPAASRTVSSGGPAAVAALLGCWWRIASETFERVIREERWCLYVADGEPLDADLTKATRLSPPQSSYWADPFAVERGGRTVVFFEEYPYATRRGVISCAELSTENGVLTAGAPRRVIEQDHHLSYPFLFEYSGDLYMIPESSADRSIGLWRCVDFPTGWVKVHDIMGDISATDTTLVAHNGRWWLFTNIDRAEIHDHCSELHLFSSVDPLARNWTPHPLNPVVRDARAARMAGPIRRTRDGRLIRPAQVNTRHYGYAVTLFEIVDLSPATYSEEKRRDIVPDWRRGITRNHHIAPIADRVIVDACHQRFKLERYFSRALGRD